MGRPPPSAKGGWTIRGIVDRNQDSSSTVRMAKHVELQNVMEMQCAGAAKQAEEQNKKNRDIILKLMRSIYFLAKVFHT